MESCTLRKKRKEEKRGILNEMDIQTKKIKKKKERKVLDKTKKKERIHLVQAYKRKKERKKRISSVGLFSLRRKKEKTSSRELIRFSRAEGQRSSKSFVLDLFSLSSLFLVLGRQERQREKKLLSSFHLQDVKFAP